MKKLLLVGLVGASFIAVVMYLRVTTRSQPTSSPSSPDVQDVSTPSQRQSSDTTASRYVAYSASTFDATKDKKRVLYFHAPWCSTCRPLDKDLTENMEQIPEDVIVFKTSYDEETALKDRYNVSYQHTFVQVDEQGNEVTKWSGGGIADLVSNVK